jgi:hypothetical protein
MTANVNALAKRLERMVALRMEHEQVWRDCFDHCFPIRGSGLQGSILTAQTALDRKARLVDDTATDAGRTLAAALVSGMTPASARWFGLDVSSADEAGRQWLDDKADQLHQEIHASTFDAAAYECSLDMVAAGWFALYVDVDRAAGGGFVFEQWPIAGVYASTSKPGGRVDTVFRKYTLTAEQAVNTFGEQCSEKVKKAAIDDPEARVEICQAIYPRPVYLVGGRMAKNLPFASCHFEIESKHPLRESGYHEVPVIVPRWIVIPDSAYAVGPMFDALPSARQLNEMVRMDMANAELTIAGMWIAEDDGVLNPRTIKVGPRKIIIANSVDSMKPLTPGGNWQLADERIGSMRAQIRKLLMADQLQPQDGPEMTATEVHVRVSMIRQLLGPIYGRLQAEYLQPLVERCFALAYRAGLFGAAPQSLQSRGFNVKFIGPLARSQKMEDVGAIERLDANLLQQAQLDPSALDVIDRDKKNRRLAEALGVPLAVIRTPDQIAAVREARSQAQAQAQQQAHAQEVSTMAAQGAINRASRAA